MACFERQQVLRGTEVASEDEDSGSSDSNSDTDEVDFRKVYSMGTLIRTLKQATDAPMTDSLKVCELLRDISAQLQARNETEAFDKGTTLKVLGKKRCLQGDAK